MEGVLCVFAYSYCEQIGAELSSSLITNLIRDHSVDVEISKALEALHIEVGLIKMQVFIYWGGRSSCYLLKIPLIRQLFRTYIYLMKSIEISTPIWVDSMLVWAEA